MKEWLKEYFRTLLKCQHPNMKYGDKLTFGIRYRDKDGNWSTIKEVISVDKKEL